MLSTRTITVFLIACLLICSIEIGSGDISKASSTGNVNRVVPQILEKSGMDESNAKTVNPSAAGEVSGLMIRVLDDKNQSTTIVVNTQMNLTWATVGSSTILDPPTGIKDKIDANLLNLTGLVEKGYLCDNQTNIIVSLSNGNVPATADPTAFTSLGVNATVLYHSESASPQMNFFAAQLNFTTILDLAESPYVAHVWLDRNFQAYLDQSVPLIKNPVEWAQIEASYNRTIDGTGVTIAILDTGIDASHPDFFFSNGTSKIAGAVSFTGEPTTDGFGHGTHVASIAAGTGAASAGQYTGVAPGATLLNVKVLDNQGDGQESWIISGIQWAVDHNASVLNMSFGTDTSSDGTDPMSTTVNWATQQGAVCAVAAGNSGPNMYTVGSPAAAELAITVGASAKDDTLASFSSTGPTSDYRVKPDVVAPGVNIVAARASGTSLGTPISQYYTMLSGTSMATPHVSGAAALLLDAHPSWTPLQVKEALANYAKDIGSNVLQQGSGRIDVCKAATASIVGNSSVSFGAVSLNTIYTSSITLQNLADDDVSATLSVETWFIGDGTVYPAASLSISSIYFSPGATNTVELTLNTGVGLPSGYFEGRITVTFGTSNISIPLFFCIVSQVNVEVVDQSGAKLMAAVSLIDATTGQIVSFSSESAEAHFTITQGGSYIIEAMDAYAWDVSGNLDASLAFIVHQEFSLGTGEIKNLQLSLASAYKVNVRTTDVNGVPLYLKLKRICSPYYEVDYASDIGQLASQSLYLTNVSEYMKPPAFFGFEGLSADDVSWSNEGILTSAVNAYFIGWDISNFGLGSLTSLDYTNSELATLNIENLMPQSSAVSTIWFNQLAGLWQTGVWYGSTTHPGIDWTVHILPYHYKQVQSTNYSQLEWSCIYAMTSYPDAGPEYFVIDRHFQPIVEGENTSYSMGDTPLLPQDVVNSPPYVGTGLYIPYYPLRVENDLFVAKTSTQATVRLEVSKNGGVISNDTRTWDQASIPISQFLNTYGYGLYTFVVKTVTSFNYSSQNTAEYTINYTSTSTDLIPPSITMINCAPCFTTNVQQVQIQLADNVGISSVSLLYSTDNGPYAPSNLNNLGNDCFSADLAIPAGAQKLSLLIEASDANGNEIQFTAYPAATRGYATQIGANLNGATITGKLTVIGGSLLQPVYLKVESNGQTMYTLTDANGNFAFNVPTSFSSQIDIEMNPLGTYDGSSWITNFLNVQTEPAGIVSISGGGWYTPATDVVLTAPLSLNVSSDTRYTFSYWDVDGASQGSGTNPITVYMNSNHTATAHYGTQYAVLFTQAGLSSDANGPVVTVNGNTKSLGDLPFALWVDSGSSVTYSCSDVVPSTATGKRFKQVSVTGPASSVTVTGPVTVTVNYATQNYLTVSTNPTNIAPIAGGGWYDESTYQTLTAPQVNGYQFSYWDVDGSSQGSQVNPITINMNVAHTAVAHFTPTTPTNVTITNVTLLKNIIGQGYSSIINITVANVGYDSATFNLTVYANSTIIGTFMNLTLTGTSSATTPFTWNTGGFVKGTYIISVTVSTVANGTISSESLQVEGWVVVTIPGDVNGDGKVNILDAIILANSFLATPDKPQWNPNADINGDNVVNILDSIIMSNHFLEHYP
jgi:subtilisin family serine protease